MKLQNNDRNRDRAREDDRDSDGNNDRDDDEDGDEEREVDRDRGDIVDGGANIEGNGFGDSDADKGAYGDGYIYTVEDEDRCGDGDNEADFRSAHYLTVRHSAHGQCFLSRSMSQMVQQCAFRLHFELRTCR